MVPSWHFVREKCHRNKQSCEIIVYSLPVLGINQPYLPILVLAMYPETGCPKLFPSFVDLLRKPSWILGMKSTSLRLL
jgi:hypothetical protein